MKKHTVLLMAGIFVLSVFCLQKTCVTPAWATSEMRAIKDFESAEVAAPQITVSPLPVTYTAETYPDPFKRPILEQEIVLASPEAEIKLPPISVDGIIWGGRFPQAIINRGTVVKVGDSISLPVEAGGEQVDIKIVSIDEKGIVIMAGATQFTLPAPRTVPPISEPLQSESQQ